MKLKGGEWGGAVELKLNRKKKKKNGFQGSVIVRRDVT